MTKTGAYFTDRTKAGRPLAMRPSALSLFWLFGCGRENERRGPATIVTIEGPLEKSSSWWDGYDAILERFSLALADEETSTVVLRFDSPGGECAGLYECVRMMRERAEKSGKRIVSFVDEAAYSAAYALACVSDEIYLPPSGGAGSVGVICAMYDRTEANAKWGLRVEVIHAGARKADHHPDKALDDDAIERAQADVDRLAEMFYELVAESRGMDRDDVAALEAGCFMGEDAIAAGLADGVMGFDELLAMLEDDNTGGAESSTNGAKTMAGKNKKATTETGKLTNASSGETDILANPQVAHPSGVLLSQASARLDEPGATLLASEDAGEDAEDEDAGDEDAEDEGDEDKGDGEGDEGAEDEDAGDEDAEDEGDDKGASSSPPARSSSVTSADVLRKVRALTGQTSPAAQIGALQALKDQASKAASLMRKAAKGTVRSLVDSAIAAGKLAPAQRAWAMKQSADCLRGYLANAAPVVPSTPLRQRATKASPGARPNASPGAGPSEAQRNVARAMGLDPQKLAAHADELSAAGFPLITH